MATPTEIEEFLKQPYGKRPVESIASQLGLSTDQVIKKACCLGLSKSNKWSPEEESLLHKNKSEVHNPLLGLPATQKIKDLPPEASACSVFFAQRTFIGYPFKSRLLLA